MTLCIVWKEKGNIHFASDSRITMRENVPVDIAIKVAAVPYVILAPNEDGQPRKVDYSGELGMCYAGHTASSLLVKEAVSEVLKNLQYAPGYTDISMDGIAEFIFQSYKYISKNIGLRFGFEATATMVVAGFCFAQKKVRAYLLELGGNQEFSCVEILQQDGDYHIIGSGKAKAEKEIPSKPSSKHFLLSMKSVIDDNDEPTVGGAIQYGCFEGKKKFKIRGIIEYTDEGVHHWRGGLDLNDPVFQTHSSLFASLTYIDPFAE